MLNANELSDGEPLNNWYRSQGYWIKNLIPVFAPTLNIKNQKKSKTFL